MSVSLEQLQAWLATEENEHLEFKEAKRHYDFEELVRYCVALANEGGGTMILGVSDQRPRRVVGTTEFSTLDRTKAGLVERLRLRIDAEEVAHPDGRVLVFQVPARPLGMPIHYRGAYWMRAGSELVPMTQDMLKRILDEAEPDFSAERCAKATLADLDPAAIAVFRGMWKRKSGNDALDRLSDAQLLADAELVRDAGVTFCALVLFGTRQALGRHLAQAEVIFEYRSTEAAGPAQQRAEFRQGFFSFQDELWRLVNLRNDMQHFQDGLFVGDVPTFQEVVVREAFLNAVSHRDYRMGGSVFIRQYARRLEVVSPGGFPPGITEKNILDQQAPRNRRIAEVFAKCGLVERAGQGVNRMFQESIKCGKPSPDFSGSDPYHVVVKLSGEITNPGFLRFLERVGKETLASFDTHDFVVLDRLQREEAVPEGLRSRLPRLVELGVVEVVGRGRGARHLLSRRFYAALGQPGTYTRRRGLDREQNKELLLRHLRDCRATGSPMSELQQVLPALSRDQILDLLEELRGEGRTRLEGQRRWARWFAAETGKL